MELLYVKAGKNGQQEIAGSQLATDYSSASLEEKFFKLLLPMQVQLNLKNVAIVLIGTFFLYLIYLLWGSGTPKLDVWIDLKLLISYSIVAVERGGLAVRLIHQEKRLRTETKSKTKEGRDEFVTRADLISNQIIQDTLGRFPGIKIVSEEKRKLPDDEVEKYKQSNFDYWKSSGDISSAVPSEKVHLSDLALWIDPLDATQEFTEDLLEYVTVMACIAVRGRPRFGVIYRPFSRQTIWGYDKYGVFPNGSVLDASSSPPNVIVVSRSHPGQVESFAKAAFNSQYSVEPVGGAGYKVLRVLNGTAAIYLHKTVVKKWDLCAGDSIIRVAGGKMLTLLGNQLSYFPDDPQVINSEGLLVTMKDTFNVLDKIKSHLAG